MNIIAIYISKNYRTGGQKRYLEVLKGLAERHHRVYLFHREDRTFPDEITHSLDCRPLTVRDGFSQQRAFTKALKSHTPVFFESLQADEIFLFGDSSLHCGKYLKTILHIPLVIALRNNSYVADRIARKASVKNILSDLHNRYRESQLCRYADKVVFQSEYDRNSIAHRNSFSLDRTAIIPNSVQASWFKEEWRNGNHSQALKNILFIGSDSKRKGLPWLLTALSELKKRDYEFTLTLVGDFPRTDLESLPTWIIHKGRVEETLTILSKCDLLIVPSLYDSFPNTVLESLFVGTPVLGTAIAGIKAMLSHDELLFKQADSEDIIESLEPLFEQKNYQRVKTLCQDRLALFDFDWIDPWESLLEGLNK